jgi:hypothetical protein
VQTGPPAPGAGPERRRFPANLPRWQWFSAPTGHQLVQELDYGGKQPFEQDGRLCVQPPGYQLAQAPFCAATVTIRRGQDASAVGAQSSWPGGPGPTRRGGSARSRPRPDPGVLCATNGSGWSARPPLSACQSENSTESRHASDTSGQAAIAEQLNTGQPGRGTVTLTEGEHRRARVLCAQIEYLRLSASRRHRRMEYASARSGRPSAPPCGTHRGWSRRGLAREHERSGSYRGAQRGHGHGHSAVPIDDRHTAASGVR